MWGGEGGESGGFRFNFGGEEEDLEVSEPIDAGVLPGVARNEPAVCPSVVRGCEFVPSAEDDPPDWDMEEVTIAGVRFVKGKPSGTAALLLRDAETASTAAGGCSLAASDVVKGTYEGGFKLWECSVDLTAYLLEHGVKRGGTNRTVKERDVARGGTTGGGVETAETGQKRRRSDGEEAKDAPDGRSSEGTLAGCSVLELGCGHGLPGIAAAFLGAGSVIFADYNPEVLQTLTAPNVLANVPDEDAEREGPRHASRFRYLGGDWGDLHDFIEPESVDLVLAAETIYSPAQYPRHVAVLKHCMKPPNGEALIAAKSYYFGVGGGTSLFTAAVEKDGTFEVDTVASFSDGASNVREILRVRFK